MGDVNEEIVFNVFAIISVIALVIVGLSEIKEIVEDRSFEKKYVSADVAGLMESLYSSPEKVSVVYSVDEELTFDIGEEEGHLFVRILDPLGEKGRITKYEVGTNLNYKKVKFLFQDVKQIELTKDDEISGRALS